MAIVTNITLGDDQLLAAQTVVNAWSLSQVDRFEDPEDATLTRIEEFIWILNSRRRLGTVGDPNPFYRERDHRHARLLRAFACDVRDASHGFAGECQSDAEDVILRPNGGDREDPAYLGTMATELRAQQIADMAQTVICALGGH